jgi:hypothetical protein
VKRTSRGGERVVAVVVVVCISTAHSRASHLRTPRPRSFLLHLCCCSRFARAAPALVALCARLLSRAAIKKYRAPLFSRDTCNLPVAVFHCITALRTFACHRLRYFAMTASFATTACLLSFHRTAHLHAHTHALSFRRRCISKTLTAARIGLHLGGISCLGTAAVALRVLVRC